MQGSSNDDRRLGSWHSLLAIAQQGLDSVAAAKQVKQKFLDELCGPDKDTRFIVGTIFTPILVHGLSSVCSIPKRTRRDCSSKAWWTHVTERSMTLCGGMAVCFWPADQGSGVFDYIWIDQKLPTRLNFPRIAEDDRCCRGKALLSIRLSPMARFAITTICTGAAYLADWQRYARKSWEAYAQRHGFELVVFEKPLDSSDRAQGRSPAWQKCLVLDHLEHSTGSFGSMRTSPLIAWRPRLSKACRPAKSGRSSPAAICIRTCVRSF